MKLLRLLLLLTIVTLTGFAFSSLSPGSLKNLDNNSSNPCKSK